VFKFFGIIFAAALLFGAGCATPSNDGNGSFPPDWSANQVTTNLPIYQPIPTVLPAVKTNPPPVAIRTNPPVVVKPVKRPPILTWTSLNRWAAENKFAAPRRAANGPTVNYSISSPRGTMILTIGSREAIWRGLELHLGFAPEIIDDQVFIHGLDLRKNLEPLLLDEPLTFSSTNRIIVIDPGHGGVAGGTISTLDKRPEKEFTLDWARRLKPLLEANGWRVFLTRTNDTDVSLSNRVAFAASHRADVFISLHFNSSAPDHKQSGLETYCLTPVGMPSTLTRGNPDYYSQMFPNNYYDELNIQLAAKLHGALLQANGEEDRGIRRARFMGVLHGHRCPAVLIEGGFLSNAREAEKIETGAFRQRLAEALANALK
jgi:N-acetylmuramoyl-L-alanine amidase